MIDDVSKTLKSILDDPAIEKPCKELFDAEILFDRPNEQFKPSQPTVNLFLYDIRENVELRSTEPLIERRNGKAEIGRPPLRVTCSYLVTAWAPGEGEQALLKEQRLLSQTLQVFSRYAVVPDKFFPSSSPLKKQEPPLPMRITQMDGIKDPADFWSAIGGKLRPSFVATVTISLPVLDAAETPDLVTERRIDMGERTSPDERGISQGTLTSSTIKDQLKIFGSVANAKGSPVKEAIVTISELGLTATTDANGRFTLGLVPKGEHTLSVRPGWRKSKLKPVEVTVNVSVSAEPVDVVLKE